MNNFQREIGEMTDEIFQLPRMFLEIDCRQFAKQYIALQLSRRTVKFSKYAKF
jgi:hypothetical protein